VALGQSSSTFVDIVNGVRTRFTALTASLGVASAGQVVGLNASGVIDPSMMPACALYQGSAAAVTAPTSSTSFTQAGLAVPFTPKVTGKILVMVQAQIKDSNATVAGNGITIQGSYGTGTAPANNVAATGTNFGAQASWQATTTVVAADVNEPIFFKSTVVLTVGQLYWFDLQQLALNTVSKCSLALLDITLQEFF
jgi:hypothetical protein